MWQSIHLIPHQDNKKRLLERVLKGAIDLEFAAKMAKNITALDKHRKMISFVVNGGHSYQWSKELEVKFPRNVVLQYVRHQTVYVAIDISTKIKNSKRRGTKAPTTATVIEEIMKKYPVGYAQMVLRRCKYISPRFCVGVTTA